MSIRWPFRWLTFVVCPGGGNGATPPGRRPTGTGKIGRGTPSAGNAININAIKIERPKKKRVQPMQNESTRPPRMAVSRRWAQRTD